MRAAIDARPLRALIVGLGSIGQRHVRNLRTVLGDEVEIVALRTRGLSQVLHAQAEGNTTVSVAERFGIREVTSVDDAIAAAPDVAFVCNPTRLHLPIAQTLAEAGCDLFLEKPIADSMSGVAELAETVRARGITVVVGCQMRFHPCLQRLHALLTAKAIGRPCAVRIAIGEYMPGWHPYEDYRESYAARRELGGGVILTLIHEIDYAYWLFGMPTRLFAVGGQLSDFDIDVEDTASVLMECRTGGRPLPVHVQFDFLQRPHARSCEVIGTTGKILIDLTASALRVYDGAGELTEELVVAHFERNQLFLDELRHFLACTRGTEEPLVPLADGIAALRVALAARESIESNRLVELT